jgi:predicted Zn-dependent protease
MTHLLAKRRTPRAIAKSFIAALCAGAAACSSTGGPLGLSPQQEQQIGQQQHPLILQEYGGEVDDAALRAYVDGITRKLIAVSDKPSDPIVVSTLDSPVVNAFALPGHVYVTRGLLSLANSEAELAGVIGHELGHVYSRHTAERVSRSNMTGIGAALIGILTGSQQTMQMAGQLGQLYLLKYSRSQEYESDLIGVRLLAKSGYDPTAQADFLNTLGRWGNLEAQLAGQAAPPEFLSTHPNSAERVRRAAAEAQVVSTGTSNRNRDEYLRRIDGMLYGDDPVKQGFIRGNEFIHPGMGLAFGVPQGMKLYNTPSAVVARSQTAQMQFTAGNSTQSPQQIIDGPLSQQLGVALSPSRAITVNGRSGAVGTARANTQSGQVDVQAYVIRWQGDTNYIFMWVTPANATATMQQGINASINSLRAIDPRSVKAPPAQRIRIATTRSGDTAVGLSAQTSFEQAKTERFVVLNGLPGAGALQAGEKVKIVR